jgi:hypothetical protein
MRKLYNFIYWWFKLGKAYTPEVIWLKRVSKDESLIVLNGPVFSNVQKVYIGDFNKPKQTVANSRLFLEVK